MNGKIVMICICPSAKQPMQVVNKVEAIVGRGLKGDRYAAGEGSFSKKHGIGSRQVSLMNSRFFQGTGFEYTDSRRNIITEGVELMWLIGREFQIGEVCFRGVKYLDPCNLPSKLAQKEQSFKDTFSDCGAIIAEVVRGGIIKVGDPITPPPKGY